ncbi:FAD-dependent oxidoreductase [Clostridium sulfidigenes]|uniref:FAD-dependent oxidoreductase n=1 Tax=Clostridium sulfidigenes TaxID=318464 RepID=A0A084JBG3_9CLOT|nr:NAD(P)/FAD-dependent oxidoreductase [Clostridium sulfidigenes]KEZ86297.1 FAD-dependent oxidoreductase [Clostridium sulfidigenes]
MAQVVIVGGGPAGMMAAIAASKNNKVILIEKNNKLGKKLFITGKGRCNVTNNKDISEFFDYIPTNPHFLYSALYTFTNEDTIKFFNERGVGLKVERGDRVFPSSDKSSDIIKAFEKTLMEKNIEIKLGIAVKELKVENNKITSVILDNDDYIECDNVILATGGASYPQTGSNGDGFRFCKSLGHNVVSIKPSLVPIEINEAWVKDLQGLSLRNVQLTLLDKNNKIIFKEQGEMLFTHFGISGPLCLSASSLIKPGKKYKIVLNLKPALSEKELDLRIQKDFLKYNNKDFKNALNDLFPQKLIPIMINLSKIPENQKVNSITKEQRKFFLNLISNLTMDVRGLRSIEEAIVTSGGIDTKEIDPSTMKSKVVSNLSFAGEVIDVDAYTGGYNVQIAISTGFIAGSKI